MPGFVKIEEDDFLNTICDEINYDFIDHIVGNMPDGEMLPTVEWYYNMLDFK